MVAMLKLYGVYNDNGTFTSCRIVQILDEVVISLPRRQYTICIVTRTFSNSKRMRNGAQKVVHEVILLQLLFKSLLISHAHYVGLSMYIEGTCPPEENLASVDMHRSIG